MPQSLDAAFSTFTDVINNHFDWHSGTPKPILTADQMASAFEAQSADGHLPIILQRFRDQMNIGSSDGGSDGGSDDSGGNDSDVDDSGSDESDDVGAADYDRELKEKKIQHNRIRKQHEANKAYLPLFDWYRNYLISHGAELCQSHLDKRNQYRTLRQKIMELDGKECGVSLPFFI
jgi:hypothetical protein